MSGFANVRDHKDPATGPDWTLAFAAAIKQAVDEGRSGVFVPAHAEPYCVSKPGPGLPSIDLSGRTGFTLAGEGSGSRIQLTGSGLGGAWNMIRIAGDCADVTVRGLYLDGNTGALSDLDGGQHAHRPDRGRAPDRLRAHGPRARLHDDRHGRRRRGDRRRRAVRRGT